MTILHTQCLPSAIQTAPTGVMAVGPAAIFGVTQVLGSDGLYHTLPTPAVAAIDCAAVQGCIPYATPAQTVAGTATALVVNPADLFARENIATQVGVSNDPAAIPAPGPAQSNWAVNLLNETLHFSPNYGWQVVDKKYGVSKYNSPALNVLESYFETMPRDGFVSISVQTLVAATADFTPVSNASIVASVFKVPFSGFANILLYEREFVTTAVTGLNSMGASAATVRIPVMAGDVLQFNALTQNIAFSGDTPTVHARYAYQYI